VFVIREADRLSPAAADTLLKVLEEPPADSILLLMSARAHELPDTVLSRCHVVTFTALSEAFVVEVLAGEGVDATRARLAARLAGGNLGRARRLATAADGLRFRDAAERAVALAAEGPTGALEAADVVLAAAAEYKKGLKAELEIALAPFLDEKGRPEDAYRGAIKRIEVRFHRRERRAERDYIDWELLAVSSLLRDRIAGAVGGGPDVFMNPDLVPDQRLSVIRAARGLAGIEEARADLAEDLNLNPRLLLERAFLRLAELVAA
jgi:DNA polymerase III subunit delta'